MTDNSPRGESNQQGTFRQGMEGNGGNVAPRIILQGGLYTDLLNASITEERMIALEEAARKGYAVLNRQDRNTAVDAVEVAVRCLEDDKKFNAGCGAFMNEKREVELDAMIMDGHALNAGSVIAVRYIQHPVSLARTVMEESAHCTLSGEGALEFALRNVYEASYIEGVDQKFADGIPEHQSGDTVTAIALDSNCHLACATSTGGIPGKAKGRVGDAPLIGCGGYANRHGAATTCGHGESITKMTLAREVVYNMQKLQQTAQEAADNAVKEVELNMRDAFVGVIAIDQEGNFGMAGLNAPVMPWVTISDNVLRYGTQPNAGDGGEEFAV